MSPIMVSEFDAEQTETIPADYCCTHPGCRSEDAIRIVRTVKRKQFGRSNILQYGGEALCGQHIPDDATSVIPYEWPLGWSSR